MTGQFSGGFGEPSGKPAAPMSAMGPTARQGKNYSGSGEIKSEDGSKTAPSFSNGSDAEPGMASTGETGAAEAAGV